MIIKSDDLNYMDAPVLERAQSILAVSACRVAIEAYRVNGGPLGGPDLDLVYQVASDLTL